MAKVIFVRHGEPTYEEVIQKGYRGVNKAFGPLTPTGINQAKRRAKLLKDEPVDLILSSPYTRSLQTAAIISKELQVDIEVVFDLHEWSPFSDPNFIGDAKGSFEEYMKNQGRKIDDQVFDYEDLASVKKRVYEGIKPFLHLNVIVVVCHGIVMSSFSRFDDFPDFCEARSFTIK